MKIYIIIFFILLIDTIVFSIVPDQLILTIRDPRTNRKKFRDTLENIGEYLALDVLNALPSKKIYIQTMTGEMATHVVCDEIPILITILRAGLPFHAGIQKVFPHSEVGFFAISRNEQTLQAKIQYVSLPNLKDRYVILSDTMLATGGSILNAIRVIQNYSPKKIFVVTALASRSGLRCISEEYSNVVIITAAIDPQINAQGYIVPGLGDAGDRAYGEKYITEEIISEG